MNPIVITADDFGYSIGVNVGIESLVQNSSITAVSVMIVLLDTQAFGLTNADLGLHLNISFLPGLANRGRFFERSRFRQALSLQELSIVRDEFLTQFELFTKRFARSPAHLNTHHGVHRNPQVLDILIELARQTNCFVRSYDAKMSAILSANGIKHASLSILVEPLETSTESSHLLSLDKVLKTCPTGTYELVCHPGFIDNKLRDRSSMVNGRFTEFSLLDSGKLSSHLHKLGFIESKFSDIANNSE